MLCLIMLFILLSPFCRIDSFPPSLLLTLSLSSHPSLYLLNASVIFIMET